MNLTRFRVRNYRNVLDSGWIRISTVTAFVGPNEAGKSNLFEALYCLNPILSDASYDIDEDWPVDQWQGKDKAEGQPVCNAEFTLEPSEIMALYQEAGLGDEDDEGTEDDDPEETDDEGAIAADHDLELPSEVIITAHREYGSSTQFKISGFDAGDLDEDAAIEWVTGNLPKFVYIRAYEMSGNQIELDQLQQRWDAVGRNNRAKLSHEDQTILVILDLAKIDIDDFVAKGQTPAGRTVRSFDKRSASRYLSQQFHNLWSWSQKEVRFDIEIDGTTLNIFAEDVGIGMPVRLYRRSTGFRWYVSFAWKFTHASSGQYKDCILLLEEPGIHLHYTGQRDLIDVFENLSDKNTLLYTTHLASMVDLANPERVRIVESSDNHVAITEGVVSSQKAPMAVIEQCLGLTGDLSGMLGNRQVLIVEGGSDALILHKLSGILSAAGKEGLSDRIYLWPSQTATKSPMYAAFAIGQHWDAAVLLDTDEAGMQAKEKIEELYLAELSDEHKQRFRILMMGKCAGIRKTDAAIEDIFPDKFYLDCFNVAYGLAAKLEDLPVDGSDMITKRVEDVLVNRYGHRQLDKRRVFAEMLKRFDQWESISDLPAGTAQKAEKLFSAVNSAFATSQ